MNQLITGTFENAKIPTWQANTQANRVKAFKEDLYAFKMPQN